MKERASILAKENFLEKIKSFVLKVLGVGALIGIGYVALKKVAIPFLTKETGKVKKLLT